MANYEDDAMNVLKQKLDEVISIEKDLADEKFKHDMKQFAEQIGIMRDSLKENGFSEEDANRIIITILKESMKK